MKEICDCLSPSAQKAQITKIKVSEAKISRRIMGFSQKQCKICPEVGDPESRDRISSLPDEVLGQILSFLPTKFAVATSALSCRWRNLYKLTTSLDFDDSVSFKPKDLGIVERKTQFQKFVDSILARFKERNVNKFRLKCGINYFDISMINGWITVACSHKIFELELLIHSCLPSSLPLGLSNSTCQNLVVLKLDSNLEVEFPDPVFFPCLKVLFLKEIILSMGSNLNGILRGCPCLEELVSEGCDIHERDLCITNPFLKRLTLDDGMTGPIDQFTGPSVYFYTPNLTYLKYYKNLVDKYFFRNSSALIEAHIQICFNDDEFDEPQDLCDAMLDLIEGVSNCELLYFSGQCLEALTSGEFDLPIFRKLTRLELGVGCDVSWNDVLLDFLSSSPCLECLVFGEGIFKWDPVKDEPEDFVFNDEVVPSCIESQLKVIEIKRFWGSKEEIYIITYFLENARVLEELVLNWCPQNREMDIHSKEEQILKLKNASSTCSIAFR